MIIFAKQSPLAAEAGRGVEKGEPFLYAQSWELPLFDFTFPALPPGDETGQPPGGIEPVSPGVEA